MFKTSVGFLDRLQAEFGDAWYRLNEIYGPMIQRWLRHNGLNPTDADDVAQNVLMVVSNKIPMFERRREGSFRNWLRQITVNCLRDYRRKHWRHASARGGDDIIEMLNNLEDPTSGLSRMWDAEHDSHVLKYAMREVQPDFTPQTWRAFYATTIDGMTPKEVAAELGITENAVSIAKSRVTSRVRKIVQGLLH
jgi:RNA polymerase sigma-70 factor (ECF subfamily)